MIAARPTPPSTSSSPAAPPEVVEVAAARAAMYRLLAAGFLEATGVAALATLAAPEQRAFLGEALGDPRLGAALAAVAAAPHPGDQALADEFHALFVVPGPRYCTPYGSVFADAVVRPDGSTAPGLLLGPSTREVAAAYGAAGLDPAAAVGELPDHVGVELLHVAWLCEGEGDALACGDARQAAAWRRRRVEFVRRHLGAFADALAARTEERARSPWFLALAALLRAFVAAEAGEPDEPDA